MGICSRKKAPAQLSRPEVTTPMHIHMYCMYVCNDKEYFFQVCIYII